MHVWWRCGCDCVVEFVEYCVLVMKCLGIIIVIIFAIGIVEIRIKSYNEATIWTRSPAFPSDRTIQSLTWINKGIFSAINQMKVI